MKLEMIGLNHTTSALAIRDKAALPPGKAGPAAARLLSEEHMEGVVILSTCNRTELYFSPTYHYADDHLRTVLAEVCGLAADDVREAYIFRDADAVNHVFRVASGLDSQLLGEVQILAQVKDAYHQALELASSNAFLNRAFLSAIECGKMVRHRTGISQGAVSVASAAVEVALRVFSKLEACRILLVGAGQTVRLTAKYLQDYGAAHWRVSNRTRAHAEDLAEKMNGNAVAYPPQEVDLTWADIVVCATSSSEPVIGRQAAQRACAAKDSSMLFLDLAVPRDIDADFRGGDNAIVYTVDDFNDLVQANLETRKREAARAEKLVAKKVEEFEEWHRENRIAPTIQQLQEVLEGIRAAHVESSAKRFRPEDVEKVDHFSKALINKVTSLIIANMKRASLDRNDLSLAAAISQAVAAADDPAVNQILEKLNHELSH